MNRCFPPTAEIREPFEFKATSSLAPLTFEYSGRDKLAIDFAIRGFNDWRNVVVANVLCRPGDTIIEIGAHLGTETIHFAAVAGPKGRVIAFEPVPSHVAHLRSTMKLNQLEHVEIVEAAVSDRAGRIKFHLAPNESNQGQGSMWAMPDAESQVVEVDTLTLDDFCADRKIDDIRLIVTDAEGGEPDILNGATRTLSTRRPYLLVENNPDRLRDRGLSSEALFEQISNAGYICHEVGRFGLTRPGYEELSNWVALPNDDPTLAKRVARRLSAAIWRAGFLPVWSGINPAVIGRR